MKVWVTCNGEGLVKALSSKGKAKEFRTGTNDETGPSTIGGVAGGFTYGGTPPMLLPPSPDGKKEVKTHGDPFEIPGVMVGNAIYLTCLKEGVRIMDVSGAYADEAKAKKHLSPPHDVKTSGLTQDYVLERLFIE